ncbi:TadE/TadG family type IV pilus assembly protein [Planobispora rosea]|uniref:TadE/TadG family type IV pilus assembly protein n=1 Tax=Planobispora rosea TaxID=35762 RepID=UPI00083A38A3|nr:TadE/TadG family type IV pilus assembly protein [Planobispora rosea]
MDRGAATAETAVAFPLALVLVLLVVQFGVWQHAVHVAEVTAAEALASARVSGAGAGDGQAKASLLLSQLGRSVLHDARASVSRAADTARVEVSGVAQSVVPFLRLPVEAVATGPVERFRPR